VVKGYPDANHSRSRPNQRRGTHLPPGPAQRRRRLERAVAWLPEQGRPSILNANPSVARRKLTWISWRIRGGDYHRLWRRRSSRPRRWGDPRRRWNHDEQFEQLCAPTAPGVSTDIPQGAGRADHTPRWSPPRLPIESRAPMWVRSPRRDFPQRHHPQLAVDVPGRMEGRLEPGL
jgi:hypothetical protein